MNEEGNKLSSQACWTPAAHCAKTFFDIVSKMLYIGGTLRNVYPTALTYFQRLTLESWFIHLEQTPLNRSMSTTTGTLQTTSELNSTTLTLPTDRSWPTTTEERYLGLTANNTTAKLTNQFPRTRLITFDWQTTLHLTLMMTSAHFVERSDHT